MGFEVKAHSLLGDFLRDKLNYNTVPVLCHGASAALRSLRSCSFLCRERMVRCCIYLQLSNLFQFIENLSIATSKIPTFNTFGKVTSATSQIVLFGFT